MAGWDVAVAVEHDPYAIKTYEYNQNARNKNRTIALQYDIEKLGRDTLLQSLHKARKIGFSDVDLIAGGPPCQGFSNIGPRLLTDPRNRLFFHFVRIIGIVRPKAFIAENVKGILSFAGGRIPGLLERIFDELDYTLSYGLVNSKDFGVPQDRARVLFIGIRKDVAVAIGKHAINLPKPCMPPQLKGEYPDGSQITVGEAISDLPKGRDIAVENRIWVNSEGNPFAGIRDDLTFPYLLASQNPFQTAMRKTSTLVYDNHTKGISQERLDKIRLIAEGSSAPSPGRDNAWRRLSRTRISHTLQAHMGKDLKEFIHPEVNRWITVREAARLQTFDDTYRFIGPQGAQLKQIGNAVPPYLGWAIGRTIGEELGLFKRKLIKKYELNPSSQKPLLYECVGLRNNINNAQSTEETDLTIAETLHEIFDTMIEAAATSQK